MFCRTKAYREYWDKVWQEILDLGEAMKRAWDSASPEQRSQMAEQSYISHTLYESAGSIEDVQEIAEQPMKNTPSAIHTMTSLLFRIPYIILEVPKNLELITSDAPCVWSDPAGSRGLLSPSVEITMPLSPRQLVLFSNSVRRKGAYFLVNDEDVVENLNKRTRLSAHEHFIFNHNKPRAKWF